MKAAFVAKANSELLKRHWYLNGGVPVAEILLVTLAPRLTDKSAGWFVMEGCAMRLGIVAMAKNVIIIISNFIDVLFYSELLQGETGWWWRNISLGRDGSIEALRDRGRFGVFNFIRPSAERDPLPVLPVRQITTPLEQDVEPSGTIEAHGDTVLCPRSFQPE